MNTPRVAILCPVYRDVGYVASQIENYYCFHGDAAVHVLHFARGGDPALLEVRRHLNVNASVIVNTNSWETSYSSCLGALLSNTEIMVSELGKWVTHVYVHTDGDLLLRGDFLNTIMKKNNAFGATHRGDLKGWYHYKMLESDARLLTHFNNRGIIETGLALGRQEGAFFEIDIWLEIIREIKLFIDREYLDNASIHWPWEEVLIPSLALLTLGGDYDFHRPIIKTKEILLLGATPEESRDKLESVVQIDDIIATLESCSSEECIGMKWFSRDLNHPARKYLSELIGSRNRGG